MNATDSTCRPALWGGQGWLGLLFLIVCWPLEMPLLGYAGYVPFALELWALKNLLWTGSPSESRFP